MIDITADALEDFLEQLGRCYHHPGRLFLVGGSSLILTAAKVSTLDIDLQFDVADEYHDAFIRCLRLVSRQQGIPVEQASPDQFIPLPKGYADRHQFIGRYGSLDVFHFDYYSVALSKLSRGNEKDFDDVVQMVRQNLIALSRLQDYYREVLPQFESFDVSLDAEDFAHSFSVLEQRLAQS
jgi:hypothetical protein